MKTQEELAAEWVDAEPERKGEICAEIYQRNRAAMLSFSKGVRGREDREDLFMDFYLAVDKALQNYNPKEGLNFFTYCNQWFRAYRGKHERKNLIQKGRGLEPVKDENGECQYTEGGKVRMRMKRPDVISLNIRVKHKDEYGKIELIETFGAEDDPYEYPPEKLFDKCAINGKLKQEILKHVYCVAHKIPLRFVFKDGYRQHRNRFVAGIMALKRALKDDINILKEA